MTLMSQDIPGDLMSTSEEFRNLAQEHSRYEEQLHQLTRQPYLSSEDILLEGQLKKLKLRDPDLICKGLRIVRLRLRTIFEIVDLHAQIDSSHS